MSDTEHTKLGRLGFKHVFSSSHVSGNRRGVVILIRSTFNYEHILHQKDREGRYVLIKVKLDGSLITLLNVYAPPNSDWRQIFDIMTSEAEGVLICGGDLNVRLNDKLDSSGASTGQTKINKKINTVMRDIGIIDVWRDLHPTVRDYTHLPHPHSVYTRIDYFLMYNTDRHRITHCEIGNIDISDHSPLYLTIDLNRNYNNYIITAITLLLLMLC